MDGGYGDGIRNNYDLKNGISSCCCGVIEEREGEYEDAQERDEREKRVVAIMMVLIGERDWWLKSPGRAEHFGYEIFNKEGFKDWKHASKGFKDHIGSHNSKHNSFMKHYDDYNNQRQSVTSIFARATRESEELYKIRLTSSLGCTRYLIAQGIAFRGHDESSTSINKGNFREMVNWVKSNDEKVRDAFDRGPKNCTITFGDIQKELATCCAHEFTKVLE
ncbi:uncharacterized protein LOC131650933 [Vicia villosa]|uniref:uncharacterized protein LOC131650933 n=1 Tax=Vicia villosa TaxID=3911 RepID=UPI00273C664D|nr:uncharacterized protein LOC131650933 [Vicia villosa]